MYHAIRPRVLIYAFADMLILVAIIMAIPMLIDIASEEGRWPAFLIPGLVFGGIGFVTLRFSRSQIENLTLHEIFLLAFSSYFLLAIAAAWPFVLSQYETYIVPEWPFLSVNIDPSVKPMDFIDGFFESMSSLTTSGMTTMTGLDSAPAAILLWRAILQFAGGFATLVGVVGVLPYFGGGLHLNHLDRLPDTPGEMITKIGLVYAGLTGICALALWSTDMTLFDAVCHAMATLSTGGQSSREGPISNWSGAGTEWILILFMLLAALPMTRLYAAIRGEDNEDDLWRDSAIFSYLRLILVSIVLLALWFMVKGELGFFSSIRTALFSVVSLASTTGFATGNEQNWGAVPFLLFFGLMLVGGVSGSLAGGIKMDRLAPLIRSVREEITRHFRKHHATPPPPRELLEQETQGLLEVMGFVFVYLATVFGVTLVVAATGEDFQTSLMAAAGAVGNVGTALSGIGEMGGSLVNLNETAKFTLAMGALLGRLEIFPVLVLCSLAFWRKQATANVSVQPPLYIDHISQQQE